MSELVDSLMNQLQGQHTQRLSQELGTDPDKTQSAIGALLPVILGAMQKKSATPGGAADLQSILAKMAGGMMGGGQPAPQQPQRQAPQQQQRQAPQPSGGMPDLGGLLSGMLGGGSQPQRAPQQQASTGGGGGAGDLLGQIFGGEKQQSRVTQGVGKATGLDPSAVGSLLNKLGPVVAGAVASKAQAQNMDAGQLGGYLQQEKEAVGKKNSAQSMLMGMILDQDGDGDFDTADMMALGAKMLFGKKS